jgi:DNA-binding FadR family transcriptional regulator
MKLMRFGWRFGVVVMPNSNEQLPFMHTDQDDLERLTAYIERAVQAGITRLPPEPRLSTELAVTRGRLRTLLSRLERDGIIWRHVGKGTFIGPRSIDPGSPEWSSGISLGDIMDARLVLEPQLAAQAAINATGEDLEAIARCLEEARAAPTYLQWKRFDEKLHRLIAEAAHNKLLLLLYETLRTQGRASLDRRLGDIFGHEASPHPTNDQHDAIAEAIRQGDPVEAERTMRTHLTAVRTALFGLR